MDRTTLEGKKFPSVEFPLEEDRIRRFTEIMDENWDPNQDDRLPLPYCTLVSMQAMQESVDVEEDLGVNMEEDTAMFGEISLNFHHPIFSGDTIRAELEVGSVDQKSGQSGEFEIVRVDQKFFNQDDTLCLEGSLSSIIQEAQ